MRVVDKHFIARAVKTAENFIDLRMPHRLFAGVAQQVLLRNIGYIFSFLIFSEQVVEGLVLRGRTLPEWIATILRYLKKWIDVKNDAAKIKKRCLTTSPIWYFAILSFMARSESVFSFI